MFLRIFFLVCFLFPLVDAHDYPLGAPVPMNKTSTEVKEFVKEIMKKYNNEISDPYYYISDKVLEATVQTVAGSLVRIKLQIAKSNCKKQDIATVQINSCNTVFHTDNCIAGYNDSTKELNVKILSQPWMHTGYVYTFV